jgi:hypothetical protein
MVAALHKRRFLGYCFKPQEDKKLTIPGELEIAK